ncbi:MAG: DUF3179 domain-containing protein [Planctomycetota bacterium]|nr:DUF3179 domain-containing protein [Planctomycetota bacterium]MDA1178889.1 DUF3179 domain-containing protein [Planctomycetota bacterium]
MARPILVGSLLLLVTVPIAAVMGREASRRQLRDDAHLYPVQVTQVQQRQPPPFDLRDLSIPAEEIRGGGPPKDGIPAITNPKTVAAAEARFLKANDRVVGVALNGQARAYPISILTQHEIVNDKLGETPIAVTYCPLCDSVIVFDRTTDIGVKEFGVSGLLYNSNVLMYDRSEKESLWSQMKMKGVSGPAKGINLQVLPMELTSWNAWQSKNPETDVMSTELGFQRDYRRNPYTSYFKQPGLMFPARPQNASLPLKERVIAVWDGADSLVVPTSAFGGRTGTASVVVNGKQVEVAYEASTDSLRVIAAGDGVQWANTFWFAWYAFHPATKVLHK